MEIERKYLLQALPDLPTLGSVQLEQGYLCTAPVIRIRSAKNLADGSCRYLLTVKGGGMTVREEFELDLTEAQFLSLKEKVRGRWITKTRYLYALDDGLTAEADVFSGCMEGLIMAEVEFRSVEQMASFQKPDWFGEDVSNDVRYHNSYMAFPNG